MTPTEIKQIRSALDLTQQALADKINVRVDTVRSWEGGRRKPEGPAIRLMELLREHRIPSME